MERMDVIKFLLKEVIEEKVMIDNYRRIVKEADKVDKEGRGGYWEYINKHWGYNIPSKTKIKADILKIRQLLLEESKDIG